MAYLCSTCNKEFATRYTLNRHVASFHTSLSREQSTDGNESTMSSEEATTEQPRSQTDDVTDHSDDMGSGDDLPQVRDLEEAKYPWEELTNTLVGQFRGKIERRIAAYQREGYDDQDALTEAYDDFFDKMLTVARTYVYDVAKKKIALENDKIYDLIETKMRKLADSKDIDDEEAWKLAIRKNDFMLAKMLPNKQDFEDLVEEAEEVDSN